MLTDLLIRPGAQAASPRARASPATLCSVRSHRGAPARSGCLVSGCRGDTCTSGSVSGGSAGTRPSSSAALLAGPAEPPAPEPPVTRAGSHAVEGYPGHGSLSFLHDRETRQAARA